MTAEPSCRCGVIDEGVIMIPRCHFHTALHAACHARCCARTFAPHVHEGRTAPPFGIIAEVEGRHHEGDNLAKEGRSLWRRERRPARLTKQLMLYHSARREPNEYLADSPMCGRARRHRVEPALIVHKHAWWKNKCRAVRRSRMIYR